MSHLLLACTHKHCHALSALFKTHRHHAALCGVCWCSAFEYLQHTLLITLLCCFAKTVCLQSRSIDHQECPARPLSEKPVQQAVGTVYVVGWNSEQLSAYFEFLQH